MATYRPGITSAALGGLLRLAQEEKQNQPHRIPPSAQTESPVRAQVQAPISAPESVGSEKVVAMKPGLMPGAEIPSPAGLPGGVVSPIVPAAAVPGGVVAPGAATPGAPGVSGGPSIASAGVGSSPTAPKLPTSLLPSAVRTSSQTGRLQVTPVPQVNTAVPVGKSDVGANKFEQLQTPMQNILGGLGKVGTQITSKLNLPQLMPGGVFKKLQDKMAPTINKLLPNFNWNKG
jgi:hypothetical protein